MTYKGWLLFIAISVFWGIPYFFIKIAVQELDPTVVVFARVAVASLVLLPVAACRKELPQLRKHWLAISLLSIVQIIGPFLLISYGEQHITSSLASLLIAAEPLLVVVFAFRTDPSERVGGLRLLGLLIGIIGVITLLGLDMSGDKQKWLGAGFVLLATSGYAASALLVKRPPFVTLPTSGIVATECSIATIILAAPMLLHLPGRLPSLEIIASLLALGLVCTALGFLTFFALINEVGASRGTVFTYVNPAIAVLLGITLLNEPFNATTLAGFLLIILGSWLSTGGTLPPLRSGRHAREQRYTVSTAELPAQDRR